MDLTTEAELEGLCERLRSEWCRFGLELSPFKVEWYNEAVADKRFVLSRFRPETLAFVVVSAPSMFEKAFLPFVRGHPRTSNCGRDPLDRCMVHHFRRICGLFDDLDVEPMHDFELASPLSKRPKVLVQTAAHVSGAARFYRPHDLDDDGMRMLQAMARQEEAADARSIFSVCMHPKYGGWFGLRGVLLFRKVTISFPMERRPPPRVCQSQGDIAELLYLYNYHWRDFRYRDVGMAEGIVERYSPLQQTYFSLLPDRRGDLLSKLVDDAETDDREASGIHSQNSLSLGVQ